MGSDFLSYIQYLEFIGFFAGYPLVYAVIFYLSDQKNRSTIFFSKVYTVLPYAYGIAGLLYIGLQLKNLYPDYSIENIQQTIQHPFFAIWAVLAIVFLIPALAKKSYSSLVHSLVFFILFVTEIAKGSVIRSTDESVLHNAMNIYTASLLFYVIAPLVLFTIYALGGCLKRLL